MSIGYILIIDADTRFADNTALLLRNEGFEVGVAQSGGAALEKLATARPDVILLDMRLPDEKGADVLKKALEQNSNFGKIIITEAGDRVCRAELLANDVVDFLEKPVENDLLLMTVKSALTIRVSRIGDELPDDSGSLGKFFPFLAHEIRNPLHAISGAITIIQKRSNSKDEVLARAVRIIQEEVKHLNGFVQECLDFVRPPAKSRLTSMNINDLVNVVINMTSYMFEELSKKVQMTKDLSPDIPAIKANYEEMKQVFLNLFRNSFEAVSENGKIHIQTRLIEARPSDIIEIVISDNGMGIKKENLKNLFNLFFTTKLRGTGLGLPICHRIISERHHGKISIRSEEGKGTAVKIELPVSQSNQSTGAQTK